MKRGREPQPIATLLILLIMVCTTARRRMRREMQIGQRKERERNSSCALFSLFSRYAPGQPTLQPQEEKNKAGVHKPSENIGGRQEKKGHEDMKSARLGERERDCGWSTDLKPSKRRMAQTLPQCCSRNDSHSHGSLRRIHASLTKRCLLCAAYRCLD